MESQKKRLSKLEDEIPANQQEDIGRSMDDFYEGIDDEFQEKWYRSEEDASRLMQDHKQRIK